MKRSVACYTHPIRSATPKTRLQTVPKKESGTTAADGTKLASDQVSKTGGRVSLSDAIVANTRRMSIECGSHGKRHGSEKICAGAGDYDMMVQTNTENREKIIYERSRAYRQPRTESWENFIRRNAQGDTVVAGRGGKIGYRPVPREFAKENAR